MVSEDLVEDGPLGSPALPRVETECAHLESVGPSSRMVTSAGRLSADRRPATPWELTGLVRRHDRAGARSPGTDALTAALCDHAHGNFRVLTTMAAELLAAAAQREVTQIGEKLFFDVFEVAAPAKAGRGSGPGHARSSRTST